MSGMGEARAVARRSLSALGRGASARAAQVIVKRVSGARTARDACRMAEYVARLGEFAVDRDAVRHMPEAGEGRGDPRPRVFDEFGAEMSRAEVVGTVREGWGLVSARDNRSPAARLRDDLRAGARLVEEGEAAASGSAGGEDGRWWLEAGGRRRRVAGRVVRRLLAMGMLKREEEAVMLREGVTLPAEEETARPQVHHFVFSVPVGERDVVRLEEAVREAVREAFAAGGHRALWAVHVDHGKRPHAHVLVQARNAWGEHLRTAAADMDVLRSRLADAASAAGLRVEATRRADRPELVADIVRGDAVLRQRLGRQDYRDGLQAWERPARELARLAGRVPAWLAGEYGQGFVRRWSGSEASVRQEGWLERWRQRREDAGPLVERLREMGVFMVGGGGRDGGGVARLRGDAPGGRRAVALVPVSSAGCVRGGGSWGADRAGSAAAQPGAAVAEGVRRPVVRRSGPACAGSRIRRRRPGDCRRSGQGGAQPCGVGATRGSRVRRR